MLLQSIMMCFMPWFLALKYLDVRWMRSSKLLVQDFSWDLKLDFIWDTDENLKAIYSWSYLLVIMFFFVFFFASVVLSQHPLQSLSHVHCSSVITLFSKSNMKQYCILILNCHKKLPNYYVKIAMTKERLFQASRCKLLWINTTAIWKKVSSI